MNASGVNASTCGAVRYRNATQAIASDV